MTALILTLLAISTIITGLSLRELDKKDQAIIACIENTSYSRDLIRQCLDDYKESR
jgi:hypothetical protein